MVSENKRVLSINAAARYSGYSRAVIEHWIINGQIDFEEVPTPGRKNRCRRIRKADLDAFLESCRKKNNGAGVQRPKKEALILLKR